MALLLLSPPLVGPVLCFMIVNSYVIPIHLFLKLFESSSSTYTYLLADPDSKDAVLIDPVLETVDRDIKLIDELGLKLTVAGKCFLS